MPCNLNVESFIEKSGDIAKYRGILPENEQISFSDFYTSAQVKNMKKKCKINLSYLSQSQVDATTKSYSYKRMELSSSKLQKGWMIINIGFEHTFALSDARKWEKAFMEMIVETFSFGSKSDRIV